MNCDKIQGNHLGGIVKNFFLFLAFIVFAIPAQAQSKSAKEDYELSARCGQDVASWFKGQYGGDRGGITMIEGGITMIEGSGSITVDYNNHYNKSLNKCFVMITSIFSSKGKSKAAKVFKLIDFNEHFTYGIYDEIVTNTSCLLLNKKCSSLDEWLHLTNSYMTE